MRSTRSFDTSFSEYADVLTPRQMKRLERKAKKQSHENLYQNHTKQNTVSNVSQISPQKFKAKPLTPKTEKQRDLIRSIIECNQVVTIGSAGTGKTYITAAMAADMMMRGEIDKIIMTRPNVPAGRSIGFLPGTLEEKLAPWVLPITEVLKERMGVGAYEYKVKNGDIEVVPFEVIRGRTFKNAFVILDEAQNTTQGEFMAFITRIGSDSKVVINGDVKQSDIGKDSGLALMLRLICKYELLSNKIDIIEFTIDDCVRSDIVKDWLRVFEKEHLN